MDQSTSSLRQRGPNARRSSARVTDTAEAVSGTTSGFVSGEVLPNEPLAPTTASAPPSPTRQRGTKRRNLWIFVLGGLFGIFIAAFFAEQQAIIELPGLGDLGLDSILPVGLVLDLQNFAKQE